MTVFLLAGAALVLVCLLILLPGLVRPRRIRDVDMNEQNLSIARDRLAELKQSGITQSDEAPELEAALLDDLHGPDYALDAGPKRAWVTAVILAIGLPAGGIALYSWLGDSRWNEPTPVLQGSAGDPRQADIPALLARLEERLAAEPDNADGWAIAGRTYMVLNDFAAAERAYARVHELVGDDPDILTAWADASLMRNNGVYTPDINARIERALELDPVQLNALWIGTMGLRSIGHLQASEAYADRLRKLLENDPEALARLESLMRGPDATQLDTDDGETVTANDAAPTGAAITVRVSLDPALASGLDPATPVFVFARAPTGPPMPLAARRLTLADLPASVTLDDSSAMIEDRNLSSVERALVTARVSLGGAPTAQPGDLTSDAVETDTRDSAAIDLAIDRVVN